jgi:hypothetical protein
MHWFLELLAEMAYWLLPGLGHRHKDESVVGKSRLDREARRLELGCLAVVALAGLVIWYFFIRRIA